MNSLGQKGFAAKDGTSFEYSEEQKANFEKDPDSYIQYCRDVEGELNKRFSLMHAQDKDQLDSRSSTADMMSDQLGGDPVLTKRMIPNFALGCRRMTPGSGYLYTISDQRERGDCPQISGKTHRNWHRG